MSSTKRDFAFHPTLWAYDVGRNGRRIRLVIRIRRTNDSQHSFPILDDTNEDDSSTGITWSPNELNIHDPPADIDELAVVVGELLPEKAIGKRVARMPTPKQRADFDEEKHQIVPTCQNTQIIVWKFEAQGDNLTLLWGKSGNTRRTRQLPENAYDRMVFYNEWTVAHSTQQGDCLTQWRDMIYRFARGWIVENRAMNQQISPARIKQPPKEKTKPKPKPKLNPKSNPTAEDASPDAIEEHLQTLRNIALYKATKNLTYLTRSMEGINVMLGRAPEKLESSDDERLLRNLINGREEIYIEEAQDAARACKVCSLSIFSFEMSMPRPND